MDPTCLIIPMSIAPIVFALAATLIFLKYPDKHLSIVLFTIGFTLLLSLFDILTDQVYFSLESLRYLFSSIAQGYAAMVGILGAFLIFYIETIKNKIIGIRKEIIKKIPEADISKTFANDEEFVDYLRGWSDGYRRSDSASYRAAQYSIILLNTLIKEEQKIKMIISNQFLFLFISIFFSLLILLPMDSFDVESPYVKLIVYSTFSFSIAALMSAIYGVYRIIYPDSTV